MMIMEPRLKNDFLEIKKKSSTLLSKKKDESLKENEKEVVMVAVLEKR